ncbi:putative Sensory box-containing diguanylate cye [Pseudomonas amygdali pv. mori]|uniref:cyclic-guanylate-specific phosphodiesterase n=9 Tax=Pseudomonas syringae group genomosp. 2 TaxID=251698 RepID=A0A3M4I7L3_PSESG|nr:putative Sensory box-containing diguanylate cyclase [Pseudomonas amygdali pv. hibisci]KPY62648.1 Sensory box/GGDEF family protein [Pseudomonas amygdali pv. sesami]KPY84710.1 putative Sensory box-containing diguanylate cye [Pseudomonas amygdali pv. tabaci]RMM63341.1 putative Sensory box-containing diguanylate cyclase [Pseudomonas savastanoi pv. glycinea]RMP31230.1 putative Sensory box-containing diguanylate cyclase [Pseudomonas amygdali pv. lachrymans]RMQ41098.1 putative Sensory box-containi
MVSCKHEPHHATLPYAKVGFTPVATSIPEASLFMKSQTDAAGRSAAEVVTQLPVPSRLGMLRFERLNEANWALLFLDPNCEKQFGLPAVDLCALIGSPYASLMEPQARYQLHDDIQQQLASSPNYLIRYTLHSPKGALGLLEIGEAYKQHNRHLLRGYFLIVDGLVTESETATDSDLETRNLRLQIALELNQRAQRDQFAHLERVRAQQDLILRLTRHRYTTANTLLEAAKLITKSACDIYDVDHVSIWNLTDKRLEPITDYRRESGDYQSRTPIDISAYPTYLQALNTSRAIDASNIQTDPRTREMAESLNPGEDKAVLDASIRIDGQVIGVLCLEQSGSTREWQSDEIAFAGELADQFAQVINNHNRRAATNALHLFQRAVEQSANAFLLVNCNGVVEYVNPSFTAITQYSSDEVSGHKLSELPALENLNQLLLEANSSLTNSNSWQGEFKSRRKNLEPYWGQLSISKVYGDNRELTHYIGIYEDITQSKLAQQRIERLAYTDNLTNLGNRPAFIRNLDERFVRDTDTPMSLLLVDIDNFKRINDSLGHQTGDKLLISLARRLRNTLSPSDVLARFASNEFAVLLDNTDQEAGQATASQVLATLDKPMFVDNQLISVTGSVGLACAPLHGRDPQTLMKNAGLALHKAKANGKHQVQVFTEALNAEASYKLFVENNLRRALTQNELEVFYQPKLCLLTGRLLGMEALLRWNHPEKGMIRPDQFISVAEETGLIIPIGKWVARQSCRMSKDLTAAGFGNLQVAINVSPKQFSDPELVSSIAAILREEELDPSLLELELTEGLLLEATEDTRQQLDSLKKLGLSLAMDDFGTGYSSFSYLKKFPIDVIKIDRSFIRDIPDDEDDMEITSAVIAMAHNLKLKVVAEGIETAAQLTFLRRHRCDVGQGYLFDKPIPGEELIEKLKRYPRRPSA